MCGRYTLTTDLDELIEAFQVPETPFDFQPRFNIAPTQSAPVVARDRRGTRMGLMRWGLIPYWAEDPAMGNRHINARSESVHQKPAFKGPFAGRRCLVPADGFYEWARLESGKQPHWIHPAGGGLMSFAGVWDRWSPSDGPPVYSFAILTRPADLQIRHIHDRMPVIVPPELRDRWLDRERSPEDARETLDRIPATPLGAHPVSTWVNRPDHDDPNCVEPLEA